jgi:hypothetical protein
MASNPFDGTEFQISWEEGFTAGFLAPSDDHPAPSPLTVDQQNAYLQGVLAGQVSKRGVVVPSSNPPEGHETWELILHGAAEVADLGHTAWQISIGAAVVGTVGEAALLTFLSVAIWGPTQMPFFEEAARQAVGRVQQQLQEAGIVSDNVELFMAACNRTDHGMTDQDELTRQGWYHGNVFLSFEQAMEQATAHGHPEDTKVLRFQSMAPDTIDVIDISN